MKQFLPFIAILAMAACKSSETASAEGPVNEHQRYIIHLDKDGALQPTPADMFLDYTRNEWGGMRVQRLEGPGIVIYDTLTLYPGGKPFNHIFRQGKERYVMHYTGRDAKLLHNNDTLSYPYEGQMYDIVQLDLVLSMFDTLKSTENVPFMIPPGGNVEFFSLAEIGPDTLFLGSDTIHTVQRYAVAPGAIYEYWYAHPRILPVQMRLTTSGYTYLYRAVNDSIPLTEE